MAKPDKKVIGRKLTDTREIKNKKSLINKYDRLLDKGEPFYYNNLSYISELSRERNFHVLVFGPLDDTAAAICRDLDLECYNTYEEIGADRHPPEYGVHEMHPSPEGHGVLALHLEKALRSFGLL